MNPYSHLAGGGDKKIFNQKVDVSSVTSRINCKRNTCPSMCYSYIYSYYYIVVMYCVYKILFSSTTCQKY